MQPLSDRTAGFTDSVIRRMTHILHEPSAAATYYLKGALCELFDFLSSGFYPAF